MILGPEDWLEKIEGVFPVYVKRAGVFGLPSVMIHKMDKLLHEKIENPPSPVAIIYPNYVADAEITKPHHAYTMKVGPVQVIKMGRPSKMHGINDRHRFQTLAYHELTHAIGGDEVDAEVVERMMGSDHTNWNSLKSGIQPGGVIRGVYVELVQREGWLALKNGRQGLWSVGR